MKQAVYFLIIVILTATASSVRADIPISDATQECLECHT